MLDLLVFGTAFLLPGFYGPAGLQDRAFWLTLHMPFPQPCLPGRVRLFMVCLCLCFSLTQRKLLCGHCQRSPLIPFLVHLQQAPQQDAQHLWMCLYHIETKGSKEKQDLSGARTGPILRYKQSIQLSPCPSPILFVSPFSFPITSPMSYPPIIRKKAF